MAENGTSRRRHAEAPLYVQIDDSKVLDDPEFGSAWSVHDVLSQLVLDLQADFDHLDQVVIKRLGDEIIATADDTDRV